MTTLRATRSSLPALLLGASLLALACGGAPLVEPDAHYEPPPEAPIDAPTMQADVPLRADDLIAHGSDDASTVVLLFSDWKCPHCATAWPKVLEAVRAHPDAQLRFRTFPLAGPCNPAITREDPERCTLARAALCAGRMERFLAYAPAAFERGEALLQEPEWQDPAFRACLDDTAIRDTVRAHAVSGTALDLKGTPTAFVRIDGVWRAPSRIDDALELLAAR